MALDARTMKKLRTTLEKRKAELTDDLSRLSGEVKSMTTDEEMEGSGLSNHLADTGSDVAEAERLVTVSQDLQDSLNEVNEALERMDNGTYGTCQRCGKDINPERLEAFPWVRYDVECQAIIERTQGAQAAV